MEIRDHTSKRPGQTLFYWKLLARINSGGNVFHTGMAQGEDV